MPESLNAGILSGVRVLDLSQVLAGPTATRLMVEMGAEVIKVELAPNGDASRLLPHQRNGRSGYFIQQNRGKRCVCINRKDERAIALVRRLLAKSDVFIENFAPGVVDRMGLGWEVVRELNPRLVMASISAFGEKGPLASLPGYDYIAAAYAGVLDMIGEADGPPYFPMLGLGDVMTGVHAAAAINGALFYRERTGKGQRVTTSLLEAYFHCHEVNVQVFSASEGAVQPRRSGSHHYAAAPCGVFPVGQEGYLFIVVLQGQWARFCEVIERPDLIDDPRFLTGLDRAHHVGALNEAVSAYLARYPSAIAAAEALGERHIPAAPILTVAQASNHAHLLENRIVREIDDPVFGRFRIPGMPLHFSEQPQELPLQTEHLGQSNGPVLRELLGLSDPEIQALHDEGVLFARPDGAA
jgi:crotonobetainyl-CoA:carnitine CoA-transferase CaiB-like acyl-CoA transferase